MKKVLVVLLTILILTASIFCFVGCSKNPDKIAKITLCEADGSVINVVELDKGSYLNAISNPKKDGFIFSGWYVAGEDGKVDFENVEPLKDTFKIEGDMTLYAKWEVETPLGDKMMIGLQAAVIGIGMVFVILAILVVVIMATKYIVNPPIKKAEKKEENAPSQVQATQVANDDEMTDELVAVITAAVTAAMNVEAPKADFVVRSIKRIR